MSSVFSYTGNAIFSVLTLMRSVNVNNVTVKRALCCVKGMCSLSLDVKFFKHVTDRMNV